MSFAKKRQNVLGTCIVLNIVFWKNLEFEGGVSVLGIKGIPVSHSEVLWTLSILLFYFTWRAIQQWLDTESTEYFKRSSHFVATQLKEIWYDEVKRILNSSYDYDIRLNRKSDQWITSENLWEFMDRGFRFDYFEYSYKGGELVKSVRHPLPSRQSYFDNAIARGRLRFALEDPRSLTELGVPVLAVILTIIHGFIDFYSG